MVRHCSNLIDSTTRPLRLCEPGGALLCPTAPALRVTATRYSRTAIVFWPRAHVDCVVHQSEAGKQLHKIEEAEEAKRQKLLAEQ